MSKHGEGEFVRDLVTAVRRVEYDFETRTGFLHMPPLCCTDMGGCIRLFERIDPKVRAVYTFGGRAEDTAYFRKAGTNDWGAVRGRLSAQVTLADQLAERES